MEAADSIVIANNMDVKVFLTHTAPSHSIIYLQEWLIIIQSQFQDIKFPIQACLLYVSY